MKNHAAQLTQAATQVCQAAEGLVAASTLQQMHRQIDEKCALLQPSIMLYGLYNAGKSTLLNALLGRQAAAVSDIPQTTMVSGHDWHGYRIFDTPGLDAPIEHEEVTRNHLAKVEVVILVVSASGSAEEERLYREIATLAADKRLLVVLNIKSDLSEAERLDCLAQIAQRLEQRLPEAASRIPLLMVNAASALKARLENKSLLLMDSNIGQLEREIERMMATTSSADAVRTAAALITPVLEQAEKELEQRMQNGGKKASETIQVSAHLQRCFRQLRTEGKELIARECQEATARIRDGISAQGDINDAFCQQVIEECQQKISEGLRQLVEGYLDEAALQLDEVMAAQPANGSRPTEFSSMSSSQEAGSDDHLQRISAMLRAVDPVVAKKMLFSLAKAAGQAANQCKWEWLKNVLIFVGRKSKLAAKLLGPVAIVVQVVANVFSLISGNRQDQAEFEKSKANIHTANQMLSDIQDQLQTEWGSRWEADCTEIWKRTEQVLAEIIANDNAVEADWRRRLEKLAEAKDTLRLLCQPDPGTL